MTRVNESLGSPWWHGGRMKAPPILPLRTDRVVLRPYAATDVQPTLDYYCDPAVSRFLLTEPFALQDAQQAVEKRRMPRPSLRSPGTR